MLARDDVLADALATPTGETGAAGGGAIGKGSVKPKAAVLSSRTLEDADVSHGALGYPHHRDCGSAAQECEDVPGATLALQAAVDAVLLLLLPVHSH